MSLASDFAENVQDITFQSPSTTTTSNNVKIKSFAASSFEVSGIVQQSSAGVQYSENGKKKPVKYDCYVDKDVQTATITKDWHVKFKVKGADVTCEITSLEDIGDSSDPYIMELQEVVV